MLGPLLLFALVTYASGLLCGSNELYVESSFAAEPTCRIWVPCKTLTASIAGCFCKPGTVRDEITGCCVNKRLCRRCGRNEYRNRRGNCARIRHCRTRQKIHKCPVQHVPNYPEKPCVIVCPTGTIKDKYGKCVAITKVQKCEEHEVYQECCPVVQATCAVPVITTNIGAVECQPGCVCRVGYVRNACGKCIPIDSCYV